MQLPWCLSKACCAVAAVIAAGGFALPDVALSEPIDRFDTIVIDAGHGGEDEGAKGAKGLLEKDLVLRVALEFGERLRARGLRVVMTRTEDVFIPLEERTSIANDARADLFVSIHANAADDIGVRGIETFFLSLEASDEHARQVAQRENEAFPQVADERPAGDPLVAIIGDLIATEHLEESNEFARLVQAELTPSKRHARGVKQAPFVVLEGVQMAASLVEIGFLTNVRDEARLNSAKGREQIVGGLVRATDEFGRRYDARRGIVQRGARARAPEDQGR